MTCHKETSPSNSVDLVSQKVSKLNNIPSIRSLHLPSGNYGPFCLKILHDFIEHHKLSSDLPLPIPGLTTHEALSRIFDVMLHSMGEEKRQETLKNLDEYSMGIPAHFRT